MPRPLRSLLYVLGPLIVVGLGLLLLARINTDEGPQTPPDAASGTAQGDSSADDALAALQDLETRMASTPIPVLVGERSFGLVPATIGFDLDERTSLDAALETGTPASVIEAAARWNQDPPGEVLPLVAIIDEAALSIVLDRLDSTLQGPSDGAVVVEGTTPIARYPSPGWVIDRSGTASRILSALVAQPRPDMIVLDVAERQPVLPHSAVDVAVQEAAVLLSAPITLARTDPDATLYLTRDQLARALVTRIEQVPSLRMVVTFDPVIFDEYLYPLRAGFESAPLDAHIQIDDADNITIIPGFPGARIDTDLVIEAVKEAARRSSRTTVLPLDAGVPPTITTEFLRTLGVDGKISEFTTNHPCCQPRVNNIQRFADAIDGTLVLPGEVISLNETVGERTFEGGYVPAPTIIRGEITDTVGGGVSQFATTFYNAVFWAGLEIIEHQPHSYYFSRYPEGIEATISWTEPDLVFRNDTGHGLVIKTSYTGTSITVKMFGNNSDREVRALVSGRFNPTEFPTKYLPNPEMMPWDEENEVQRGANGWSVKVTRTLEFTNGSTTSQDWVVRYRPWPREVEVHPCLLPEDSDDYTGEECPSTPTVVS
ncbi:MAG: VanW family protein [bacterium]|nr:VanW family protein [bacterium]